MAGYISYMSLKESAYQKSVADWHESQLELVRKALADGKWLKLKDISFAYDWNLSLSASPGLAAAESYLVVSYLATTYGLDKCASAFMAVSHNASVEGAVYANFNLNLSEIEAAAQAWINAQ